MRFPSIRNWPKPAKRARCAAAIRQAARMACKPDFVPGLSPLQWPFLCPRRCRRDLAANPGLWADASLWRYPRSGPAHARPLFGIAPGGACRASSVARPAVGFYPAVSPSPRALQPMGQTVLCGAFPGVTPAGRYPAPLPHGVRTFLASVTALAAIRPSARAGAYPARGVASTAKRPARSVARARSTASSAPVVQGRKRSRNAASRISAGASG